MSDTPHPVTAAPTADDREKAHILAVHDWGEHLGDDCTPGEIDHLEDMAAEALAAKGVRCLEAVANKIREVCTGCSGTGRESPYRNTECVYCSEPVRVVRSLASGGKDGGEGSKPDYIRPWWCGTCGQKLGHGAACLCGASTGRYQSPSGGKDGGGNKNGC